MMIRIKPYLILLLFFTLANCESDECEFIQIEKGVDLNKGLILDRFEIHLNNGFDNDTILLQSGLEVLFDDVITSDGIISYTKEIVINGNIPENSIELRVNKKCYWFNLSNEYRYYLVGWDQRKIKIEGRFTRPLYW